MADVIPVLQRVQFANYFISASVPLLIYDFCLTLDDEVSLIWGSKLSWIKILYFMNRLAPFSDAILGLARRVLARDEWMCQQGDAIVNSLVLIGLAVAEALLVVRTCAIWRNSTRVAYILWASFVGFSGAAVIILARYQLQTRFITISATIPGLRGCLEVAGRNEIWKAFLLLTISETVILAFTVAQYCISHDGQHTHSSRLFTTLYRDGMMYYLYFLLPSIANIVVLVRADPERASSMIQILHALHSILVSRVILRLRKTAQLPAHEPLSMLSIPPVYTVYRQYESQHDPESHW